MHSLLMGCFKTVEWIKLVQSLVLDCSHVSWASLWRKWVSCWLCCLQCGGSAVKGRNRFFAFSDFGRYPEKFLSMPLRCSAASNMYVNSFRSTIFFFPHWFKAGALHFWPPHTTSHQSQSVSSIDVTRHPITLSISVWIQIIADALELPQTCVVLCFLSKWRTRIKKSQCCV